MTVNLAMRTRASIFVADDVMTRQAVSETDPGPELSSGDWRSLSPEPLRSLYVPPRT